MNGAGRHPAAAPFAFAATLDVQDQGTPFAPEGLGRRAQECLPLGWRSICEHVPPTQPDALHLPRQTLHVSARRPSGRVGVALFSPLS